LSCGEHCAVQGPFNNFSCKVKFKYSEKNGLPKKGPLLKICCYDEPECKTRLGKTLVGLTPIKVEAKVNDAAFQSLGLVATDIVIDPIGVIQLPTDDQQSCREGLGLGARKMVRGAAKAARRCRSDLLGGEPADCSVSQLSFGLERERQTLHALASACAAQGSPADLGYGPCAPPCDSIPVAVCVEGSVGGACTVDADCDLPAGTGNGRCGDWNGVADCIACRTEAAVFAAFDIVSALPPPPGQTFAGATCQDLIGKQLERLIRAHVRETVNCQVNLDGGKKALPPGACSCKEADPAGKRAQVEAKAQEILALRCNAITDVNSCGGPVLDFPCLLDNAHAAAETVANTAFPEQVQVGSPYKDADADTFVDCHDNCPDDPNSSQQDTDGDGTGDACDAATCGDGVVQTGEDCDPPNDSACPGQCAVNCQCP
jgi:hypothetical protein